MDATRIATLLHPFLGGVPLSASLAGQLQAYLDLLLRWNARMNLTAVREPNHIVTRHFGESFFAARVLQNAGALAPPAPLPLSLADVGSGAGLPGVPIKLAAPAIGLTLIESQNKKAVFLRELLRTLGVQGAEVFCGRAEDWQSTANIVTLRAVEKFENTLECAAALVAKGGKLCLLIGTNQAVTAEERLGQSWRIAPPVPVPLSDGRIVLVASRLE